ncbi:MAG TPA: DNA alkylation repair protein [Povalibacter sp.]
MATAKKKKKPAASRKKTGAPRHDVDSVIASLKRLSSKKTRDGMARYGLPADHAMGVGVGAMRQLAKRIGPNHDLALELWQTGWYEARMVAVFIDEPARVTAAQMDRWCRDFDNWGICDTACFVLFDQLPHAFRKVSQWSRLKGEFQRRGAFALLACLALHHRDHGDDPFVSALPLIERAATDERNFVCKAVNWALRSVGERSHALHSSAIALAQRLAASPDPTSRWIGKDALRQLNSAAVVRRLAAREKKRGSA